MNKPAPALVELGIAAENLLHDIKYHDSSVGNIYMSYPESEQMEAMNRLREMWGKDVRRFVLALKRVMGEI